MALLIQILAILSISIRLFALGWTLILLRRLRDWRVSFFMLLMATLTLRQLTTYHELQLSFWVEFWSLAVSLFSALTIVFLDGMITDQRQKERALRDSVQIYRTIFETSGTAMIIVEDDTTISLANNEFETLSGYAHGEIEGRKKWTEFFAPEVLEGMRQNHQLRRDYPYAAPRRYGSVFIDKLGQAKDVLLTVGLIPGSRQSVCALLDVSDLKRTERYLQEAEVKYRSIFENAIEGIFQTTSDGHYLSANPALARIYGFESPEQLMASLTDIEHQLYVDPGRRGEFIRLMQEKHYLTDFVSQVFRKDGSVIWIVENARAVHDDYGHLLYYEGSVEDITERRRVEEQLRLLASAVRHAHDSIVITTPVLDKPGPQIVFVNPAFTSLTGYSPEEAIGQTPRILQGPKTDRTVLNRLRVELAQRQLFHGELINYRKDGSEFYNEFYIQPIRDEQGEVTHYVGIQRDITEHKRTEKALQEQNRLLEATLAELKAAQSRLIEQERLRALGQMASGIAHDINNALSPILGFSELLLKRPQNLTQPDKVKHYIEAIHTSAEDAAHIVQRLREFYRHRERNEIFSPVNLNQLVEQCIMLTQPRWKDQAQASGVTIQVATELGQVPQIGGAVSELREALINLIFNAVDAMPNGGTLTFRTHFDGRAVSLEVHDSGVAMSEEVLKHCLEPFFTTKGEHGSGLGLAMVYGIIKRHEGTIEIHSHPGFGTSMVVQLPGMAGRAAAPEEFGAPDFEQPLTVLVVDDDSMVLEVVKAYLLNEGFAVETAACGREGLEKFQRGHFDLVITDKGMPEMSGDQIATTIKAQAPAIPVIMLTGFGDLMLAFGEHPPGVDYILSKPVTLNAIREMLAKVKQDFFSPAADRDPFG